ncbi:MAG: phytoene desaturase [Bacteroidetes bacterium]|nr:phytoene desaturase [Bacteroidota bacterium]
MKKVIVIGAGFSGIAAATHISLLDSEVIVFDNHSHPGGRARKFEKEGFTFDMGPSWYWMPDVFENHFKHFGRAVSDFYTLKRLDPSYQIYFSSTEKHSIPAHLNQIFKLFEILEPYSSNALKQFLAEGQEKYKVAMSDFVFKPSLSIKEYFDLRLLKAAFKLHMFTAFSKYTSRFFKDSRVLKLLEFPILFLGGTGDQTPAMYSLMNYADMVLGTWYPMGGMFEIVSGMEKLAKEKHVLFKYNETVEKIVIKNGKATGIISNGVFYEADAIIASADYHYIEQNLIAPEFRKYSTKYWEKRKMSPSCLIFYIGVNKKIDGLEHHNLMFDTDFNKHAQQIYNTPSWPEDPAVYICAPSITDPTVAPKGYENLFVLIPLAAGLSDNETEREKLYLNVMKRLEILTNQSILPNVIYKKSYAMNDFAKDYNAFKGNAYGLSNTLLQTAFLKPKMTNKKVSNLVYTGQLTVPGPGIPSSIISGNIAAQLIKNILF